MSRPFLFGGSTSGSTNSKYLVEFKAGKMEMKGTTVTPLTKKGLLYLHQGDDNLVHFCWKDRQSGTVEEDLIIFPEEAEFKRVTQCTTGRVYMLKFKGSSRKCFYWLQEPKEDKDEEYCKKVNDTLNNPPAPGSRSGGSGGTSGLAGGLSNLPDLGNIQDSDLQNLLNNMNPQHLIQILGGAGLGGQGGLGSQGLGNLLGSVSGSGSSRRGNQSSKKSSSGTPTSSPTAVSATTTPTSEQASASASTKAAAAAASAQPAIQLSDLQSIISTLTTTQGQSQEARKEENVDLAAAINNEALQSLLANEDFMSRVRSHLPAASSSPTRKSPEPPVSQQVADTVQSPQFKQALSTFSMALQSGQLGPLMQQFDLSQACVDAANEGDLEKFVKALEESEKNKKKRNSKTKDDEMALD